MVDVNDYKSKLLTSLSLATRNIMTVYSTQQVKFAVGDHIMVYYAI